MTGFHLKRDAGAIKLKSAWVFPEKKTFSHRSDCAVHNGPAYPAGPCDCGVAQETVSFPCCGYTDAIHWNPFNGVVQCHMCGQIYTAAAKPAQEPVMLNGLTEAETNSSASVMGLTKHMRPMQEPVARVRFSGEEIVWLTDEPIESNTLLYTKPPRREWVGLTDEEMYLNCPNWLSQDQCKKWVEAIEAKLKEKNT